MSADNYYFVGKNTNGEYEVSHRYASIYYSDEVSEAPLEAYQFEGSGDGWSMRGDSRVSGFAKFPTYEAALAAATRRPDWIDDPPKPRSTHRTLADAILQAHKYVATDYVVEYGVVVQEGLIEDATSS